MSKKPNPPSRIVAATGVAASALADKNLGKMIEKAMTDAITQANKEGITDPVQIKERMMAAREKVKQERMTTPKVI